MPLNVTALAFVKFVPEIVTDVPTRPLVGENDEIVGAATVEPHASNLKDPIRVRQTLAASVVGFASMYSFVYQNVQPSTGSIVIAL